MTVHITPREREATKAAAVVAFIVSGVGLVAVVALVIAHSAGAPIPLPLPLAIAVVALVNLVACFGWARHTTRKKGR
ncbi:hypothetical protein ACIFOC_00396 [Leucobacter aridicollis]|uniref:hypothetical protein n=1 Tax=Leucobacter aridicollis TaxID=283878 RepID=UPI0037CBB37B